MGLIMACYLGLYGILSGPTKSTDHPRSTGKASGYFGLRSMNYELLECIFAIFFGLLGFPTRSYGPQALAPNSESV